MRRPLILALFALGCLLSSSYASAADWKLVWADEFNTPGSPDPKNWTFETGFVRNHELQWYQSSNARCENGLLIIEARREAVPNPNYRAVINDVGRRFWVDASNTYDLFGSAVFMF